MQQRMTSFLPVSGGGGGVVPFLFPNFPNCNGMYLHELVGGSIIIRFTGLQQLQTAEAYNVPGKRV